MEKVTREVIAQWYADIKAVLTENGHVHLLDEPRRNFNCDETSAQLGNKSTKVIAARGTKKVYDVS